MSWVDEETLASIGKQDSTGHDVSPGTSKSSSPSEDLDSRILRGYYGAKGSGDSGPFDIKPKAHAEEEDPILGKPKSWERKALRRPRQST